MKSEDRHSWTLISDLDPKQTEVCVLCGAQRDITGVPLGRASLTGGWPSPVDCNTQLPVNLNTGKTISVDGTNIVKEI